MAARARNPNAKPRRTPLYHAAKISDYRFRKVLEQFVRDRTATETARATGLSVNSVNELFQKLRAYFFQAGLFMNFYGGTGWAAFDPDADKEFERDLLAFHRRPLRNRRGVKNAPSQPDYHLAESWWRLDFAMIMRERPSEAVYDMMMGQLIAVIRVAGPIGKAPGNPVPRRQVIATLVDQKIVWLQRNAASFANPHQKSLLQEAINIRP